jgi:hypothetical protein
VPVPCERDRDECLRQEDPGDGDRHEEEAVAAAVELEVPPGREGVERTARDREADQRPGRVLRWERPVEGRRGRQRPDGPPGEHRQQPGAEQTLVPQDGEAPGSADLERGERREAGSEEETDRRCDHEPGVLTRQQDAGRREARSARKPALARKASATRKTRASLRRRAASLGTRPTTVFTIATRKTSQKCVRWFS